MPCLLLFGGVGFLAGVAKGFMQGLAGAGVGILIVAPMVLVYAAADAMRYRSTRPTVAVSNGTFSLRLGDESYRECPLLACRWFLGSMSQMDVVRKVPMPSGPAILIVVPPTAEEPREEYVAVGYSDQTRAIWKSFLELAGVERRAEWESEWSWKRIVFNVLAGILVLPLAVAGCWGVGWVLRWVAAIMTGSDDFGQLLYALSVFPVACGLVLYVAYLRPWERERGSEVESDDSRREYHTAIWRIVFFLNALCGGLVVLAVAKPTRDWGLGVSGILIVGVIAVVAARGIASVMSGYWPSREEQPEML